MDKRKVGESNILNALTLIWNHGWLRPQELGLLMWPKSNSYKKNAEALVRKLIIQNLVIARKLPTNSGTCLVLSKNGADALLGRQVYAKSGKDFGDMINGVWRAPLRWKHDLLCSGTLAHLNKIGYEVITERQIKWQYGNMVKVPDGIFYKKSKENGFWLEVENQRKGGDALKLMVDTMMRIKTKGKKLFGKNICVPAVAYAHGSLDEKGYAINHQKRIISAFKKLAPRDYYVNFIGLSLYGAGVESFKSDQIYIESNLISETLRTISFHKNMPSGEFQASTQGVSMVISEDQEIFNWSVSFYDKVKSKGTSDTSKLAERACITEMLKIQNND